MRRWMILVVLGSVASECSVPPAGPPKYGRDAITELRIEPGRMCTDPAGASIELHGTYTTECVDEDQCGRELGEVFSVEFVIDGSQEVFETELSNGDAFGIEGNCANLTDRYFGEHPTDGPGRDAGGLQPDCTLLVDGPAMAGLSDLTLSVSFLNPQASAEYVCPGEPPYGALELTSLEVAAATCTEGATLALGGQGRTRCQDAGRCTVGEYLTFDYSLGTGISPTEVTLSNSETLHSPYACVHANVSVWGMEGNERKRVGTMSEACTLSLNADKWAATTDHVIEGDYGWLPEVNFSALCD